MTNVEHLQPTEVFNSLIEYSTYVNCFNGNTGKVVSKNKSIYYVTLDNGLEFHVLNIKEIF